MSHDLLIAIACYLLSGLLNVLLSFKTPEQWEEYAAAQPRGAAVLKVLRKVGLDVPGLIRAVRTFLSARSIKGDTQ